MEIAALRIATGHGNPIGDPTCCLIKRVSSSGGCTSLGSREFIVSGMNEVAVARHGPILRENEATCARKVFKYPRGLQDIIKQSKMHVRVQKVQKPVFTVFFNIRPLTPVSICWAPYCMWGCCPHLCPSRLRPLRTRCTVASRQAPD